jgi:hypothetical protein
MKVPHYDIWANEDFFQGAIIETDQCIGGDWVKREDLISWLQQHLREGVSLSLYTDLMYQLTGE